MSRLDGLRKFRNLMKWLKEASKDPLQRAVCINIINEYIFGNIANKDLVKILSGLDKHIERERNAGKPIENQLDDFLSAKPGSESVGKGQIIRIENGKILSRVLPLESIRTHCIREGYSWDLGIKIDSSESIRIFSDLVDSHDESDPKLINFGGSKGIFWFTKTDSLDSIGKHGKKGNIAFLLRNALGLIHEFGRIIAEIRFKSDSLKYRKKPTIFDSDFNIFFKTKDRDSNWGFTLNLETLEESLPECIHENMDIWPNIVAWRVLGNPTRQVFPEEQKWEKLCKNLIDILCREEGVDEDILQQFLTF